jgi:hypothetical protein
MGWGKKNPRGSEFTGWGKKNPSSVTTPKHGSKGLAQVVVVLTRLRCRCVRVGQGFNGFSQPA